MALCVFKDDKKERSTRSREKGKSMNRGDAVQQCDLQCWAVGRINLWETWAAWQSHSHTGLTGRRGQDKQTCSTHNLTEQPDTQIQLVADTQPIDMRCNNTQCEWAPLITLKIKRKKERKEKNTHTSNNTSTHVHFAVFNSHISL